MSSAIRDMEKHVERVQGDPNAHESVRCKVEVGGDASGAEVKRAIEDAVKASGVWIACGGNLPVGAEERIDVMFDDGAVVEGHKGGSWIWGDEDALITHYRMHEKADETPTEWDGVGAPPVGSFVEYSDEEFAEAVVIGRGVIDPSSIVIEFRDGGIEVTEVSFLRPIRSEREKAVEEAMKDIDAEDGDVASIIATVERMVAAGYRKTEGV